LCHADVNIAQFNCVQSIVRGARKLRHNQGLGSAWRRYWCAEGGRLSAAILRIAIAAAVWWSLALLRAGWPANAPGAPDFPGVYHPIGVWALVGDHPPSQAAIEALWTIARVSTLAMLIGAFSRTATAVSCAATIFLASLSYTGSLTWAHQFNPVLLAQLAFLGARGGDALSIDALARRARGEHGLDVERGYQWSIRLVQLTVALVFTGALYHKLRAGGFTFAWATTDNLRHQLLLRYDVGGIPRPLIVDWLLASAWRYHTAAALSMISQAMPIVACFAVRRPALRAACGAFFVTEVLGIAAIMQWWNVNWLPLAVVFVDWEALCGVAVVAARPVPRIPRVAHAFIVTMIAAEVLTAFPARWSRHVQAYPFTSFQMFAAVRAREPYDRHLAYGIAAGQFALDPPHEEAAHWLDQAYRPTLHCDPDELPERLAGILGDARRHYPDASFRGIRLDLAILETPAYPAPAKLESHVVGTIAELRDGHYASELGKPQRGPLLYFRSDRSEAFSVPVAGTSIVAATGADRRWVVRMPRR
jgi:hypothetical protein